jgi:hypothetical protein
MQYKVGHKFKALQHYETNGFLFKKDDIIMVVVQDHRSIVTKIMNTRTGSISFWQTNCLCEPYMKFISDPPRTEIEWLDRVKENFKS